MPGFLLSQGSRVSCAHQGSATPTAAFPRVTVGGQAVILLTGPWTIAGCPFPPPPTSNGPCVTGTFTSGTVRVTASKQPLAIQAAPGTCVPTGVPLLVMQTQTRVRAS
jgi:hypothetical protein